MARKGSLGMVRRFIVGKLQTSLSLSLSLSHSHSHSKLGVKQGHFVVVATRGRRPERFVMELGCLNDPEFLKLLKQAEEEFGFSQEGALEIPCHPDDLHRILRMRSP